MTTRKPVEYPVIPPAKDHVADMATPTQGGTVDRTKLLAFLSKRAGVYSARRTSGLVPLAIYEGLSTRVRNGEFNP